MVVTGHVHQTVSGTCFALSSAWGCTHAKLEVVHRRRGARVWDGRSSDCRPARKFWEPRACDAHAADASEHASQRRSEYHGFDEGQRKRTDVARIART